MDIIFFNPAEFQRLYNCSAYNLEDFEIGQRRRPILGAILLVAFCIFEALYAPMLVALWRHLKESGCYKMMFCIGIIDVVALFITALLSGIFALQGAVFCSFPILNIVAGFFGMFFWHAETHLAILLALNRLLSLACPFLCKFLFRGPRTWICCSICLIYSAIFAAVEFPLCWSSITFSWFFDPHIGYLKMPENSYQNRWDALEGFAVSLSMPIIYLAYFGLMIRFSRNHQSQMAATQNEQMLAKIIFAQVFVLSTVNSLESMVYVLMGIFPSIVSPQLVIIGTFSWTCIHGLPPIIYFSLNKSLRKECHQFLFGRMTNGAVSTHHNTF